MSDIETIQFAWYGRNTTDEFGVTLQSDGWGNRITANFIDDFKGYHQITLHINNNFVTYGDFNISQVNYLEINKIGGPQGIWYIDQMYATIRNSTQVYPIYYDQADFWVAQSGGTGNLGVNTQTIRQAQSETHSLDMYIRNNHYQPITFLPMTNNSIPTNFTNHVSFTATDGTTPLAPGGIRKITLTLTVHPMAVNTMLEHYGPDYTGNQWNFWFNAVLLINEAII